MKSTLTLLLMCGICCACTRNNDQEIVVESLSETETIQLAINIPTSQQISSYAAGVINENKIESADALVFNATTHKYIYHTKAWGIMANGATNRMDMKINRSEGTDPKQVYIVLIANADSEIASALATGMIDTDKTEQEVMSKLLFVHHDKWSTISDVSKKSPMWGISNTVDLEQGSPTVPISMVNYAN